MIVTVRCQGCGKGFETLDMDGFVIATFCENCTKKS